MSTARAVNDINEPSDSSLLATNLQVLMRKHKINAAELARQLNVPRITIARITSGETADPRLSTLKMLAAYFNVPLGSLVSEPQELFADRPTANLRSCYLPILEWSDIEKSVPDNTASEACERWLPFTLDKDETLSTRAFAIQSRPSMYPRFMHGTLFIIDPDIKPTDGDMVLIKIHDKPAAILRTLYIDHPEWQLHSLTEGVPSLRYDETEHQLVGVNILTLLRNRKNTAL